jgi:L-alanine-DL-glutamate epimerase-like enolase superfamily enzyme
MESHLDRRSFLRRAGLSCTAGLSGTGIVAGFMPPETLRAVQDSEPMKISKIEVVRFKRDLRIDGQPIPWMWVRLHTNTGIVGVGETYPFTEGQVGMLKDLEERSWMGQILGRDPRDIEKAWHDIFAQIAFHGWGGSDMRILTAINIAQWDILGKSLGVPVYRLLGGKAQQKLRVYNTYTSYWNINGMQMEADTEKIVRFLLDRGIKSIKIYPYEKVGAQTGGTYISAADLDHCLDWIKRIRDSVGDEMEIALDLSSQWNLPCALRIAHSLEPYKIMWLEDVLLQDNMHSYATLARETSIPICISERLATRYQFRDLLEVKAGDIVMYDVTWCGGISEAKKISDMADAYYIPTAPHTCGGPILWFATIQTATALTNFFIMESCYHFYNYQYPYFIANVPVPKDGFVTPPEGPGLGIEFRPEPFERGDAVIEKIAEA